MLTPKNIIIAALTVLLIIVGGLFLWQRNTVTKQTGQIKQLQVTNDSLASQIVEYKANLEAIKYAQGQQQIINNHTETIREQIKYIQTDCKIGEQDAKTINNITDYFNHGVRGTNGDTKADSEVLPKAGSPDVAGSQDTKTIN
jgi:uncharacterized protein YxeA